MKKVFIVGSNGHCQYAQMYINEGYTVVDDLAEAELVQFTGGEDVSPDLYGCGVHPTTGHNPRRDKAEEEIYRKCNEKRIPMVGICRGGQFLNVMCGGRMFQHVDGHAIRGTHLAFDTLTNHAVQVTSTHHQMMIPGATGQVLCSVPESRCKHKDYVDSDGIIQVVVPGDTPQADDADVESVFYPHHQVLCFQPHPEYAEGEKCRKYFFGLLEGRLLHDWTLFEELTGYDPYDGDEEDYEDD